MKYSKVYMFGGLAGKKCDGDFIKEYIASNGKKIECRFFDDYTKWYIADGKQFDTLKDAKAHIEKTK